MPQAGVPLPCATGSLLSFERHTKSHLAQDSPRDVAQRNDYLRHVGFLRIPSLDFPKLHHAPLLGIDG